ncbi:hypothetical protein RJT34_30916 [Clitoria ternatea]|uniref:Uncharacterized protein n=1 Tax=Clitoria ternatea TaxID=43366 RepID=A0AAN9F144_CLITE
MFSRKVHHVVDIDVMVVLLYSSVNSFDHSFVESYHFHLLDYPLPKDIVAASFAPVTSSFQIQRCVGIKDLGVDLVDFPLSICSFFCWKLGFL